MDALATGKDKIFPHQVSCLVLIYHVCKQDSENELSALCKKWRCPTVLLILSLIQKIHLDYEKLLARLEKATSKEFVRIFEERMDEIIRGKYMGLLDLFDSLEAFTIIGNRYVHRCSLFGIFLRQMFLLYQKMSFTDTGDLGKALEAYLKPKVSNEMQDPQMLSDMEIDNGEDQKEVPHEEMSSISEAGRFIATQTRLIESQTINRLSPKELHIRIQDIIHKFPFMVDAYYLSYLNQLQIGEVRNSLFDLHRYFDYKKWEDTQVSSETEKTSLEKHQMKFKRFRYCALNLGIFHFHHEHYSVSLAALEEAVKMAQETNDNYCLLHAMFWIYQLKLESDPKLAERVLTQFNEKAKELGVAEFQILGILLQCKSDAFNGNATFSQTLERLKEIDSACAVKNGICEGKLRIAKSALLDFYGYRTVSLYASQMVLFHLQNNSDVIDDQAFSLEHADPESFILAVCQFARCLADEGLLVEAEKILRFGSSLVPDHSNQHKWPALCKLQLLLDRCFLSRDFKSAKVAIDQLKAYDKEDAKFRNCVLEYLEGNVLSCSSNVDHLLDETENRLESTIGHTPGAVYVARVLQLKAELFASSNCFEKSISYLTKATDVCRKFEMKTMEAEIAISIAQCKIHLGLPFHAKQMINQHIIRILSHGTLYAKCLAFTVLAKTSLFCLKGVLHDSRSELLQLLPSLERSLQGFVTLEASAAQAEVLFMMALIYDVLEYTAKRNQCAKDFKGKHEADAAKCPVKLFI